jgi:hypothetical protein
MKVDWGCKLRDVACTRACPLRFAGELLPSLESLGLTIDVYSALMTDTLLQCFAVQHWENRVRNCTEGRAHCTRCLRFNSVHEKGDARYFHFRSDKTHAVEASGYTI